jgi:hypothetical protein
MYKYIIAVFPKEKYFDFSHIGDIRFQYPKMGCILVPFGKIEDVLAMSVHLTEEGYSVYPIEEVMKKWSSNLYI